MLNPRILSEGDQSFDGREHNHPENDETTKQEQSAKSRLACAAALSACLMGAAGCGAANVQVPDQKEEIHVISGDKPIDVKVAQPESPEPEKKLTQEEQVRLNKVLLDNVRKKDLQGIQKALDDGADINAKVVPIKATGSDFTPLIYAAREGYIEIVKLLLSNGADIEIKTGYYLETALVRAMNMGRMDVVKLLIEKGADVNTETNSGKTLLGQATYYRDIEIVKLLLSNGADMNKRNSRGETVLMVAARYARIDIVKLLIEKGADVNAKCNAGVSVVGTADWIYFNIDVIKLLVANGAKITKQDKKTASAKLLDFLNGSEDDESIKNFPEIGTTWDSMINGSLNGLSSILPYDNPDFNTSPARYFSVNWENKNTFENAILSIADSPELVSTLYKWSLPIIKKWNESLSPEVQSIVRKNIKQTIKYSQNFNKRRDEKRFVEREEGSVHQFESFWFRRFDNGLDRKVVLKYARKLLKELSN